MIVNFQKKVNEKKEFHKEIPCELMIYLYFVAGVNFGSRPKIACKIVTTPNTIIIV